MFCVLFIIVFHHNMDPLDSNVQWTDIDTIWKITLHFIHRDDTIQMKRIKRSNFENWNLNSKQQQCRKTYVSLYNKIWCILFCCPACCSITAAFIINLLLDIRLWYNSYRLRYKNKNLFSNLLQYTRYIINNAFSYRNS